jgi:hypothetical protein
LIHKSPIRQREHIVARTRQDLIGVVDTMMMDEHWKCECIRCEVVRDVIVNWIAAGAPTWTSYVEDDVPSQQQV